MPHKCNIPKLNLVRQIFDSSNPMHLFLNKQGKLTESLIEFLKLDGLYEENDDFSTIVKKTQKHWIKTMRGREGKERTDLIDTSNMLEKQAQVIDLIKKMGILNEQAPLLKQYDYAACLGTFLDGVRRHLAYFVKTWESGIHFNNLIFFTGERVLRKEAQGVDSLENLLNPALSPFPFKPHWKIPESAPYETEYDMIKLVWSQIQIPEDMEEALRDHVVFVNATKGIHHRPSTGDAYEFWLQEFQPEPGTVLAISYPILWSYQHLVGMNTLGPDYPLNTIGPEASLEDLTNSKDFLTSLTFDTIAKCLFEINKSLENGYNDLKKAI